MTESLGKKEQAAVASADQEALSTQGEGAIAISASMDLEAILGKKRRRISMPMKLALAGLLAAVVAGIGYTIYRLTASRQAQQTQTPYREYTVERGSVILGQTESSSISLDRESISYPFSATVEEVYVKAGSSVKEGDPLVRFNVEQVQTSLNSYAVALQEASLNVQKAQLEERSQALKAQQARETSLEAGDLADANYALDITQLEEQLWEKEQALADATLKVEEYSQLNSTIYSDLAELEDLEMEMESLSAQQSAAQTALTQYKAYAEQLKTYQNMLPTTTGTAFQSPGTAEADAANAAILQAYKNRMDGLAEEQNAALAAYNTAVAQYNIAVDTGASDVVEKNAVLEAAEKEWKAVREAYDSAASNYNNAQAILQSLSGQSSVQFSINAITASMQALGISEAQINQDAQTAQNAYNAIKAEYDELKAELQEKYNGSLDADSIYDTYVKAREEVSAARLALRQQELANTTGLTSAEHTLATAQQNAEIAELTYQVALMESAQKVDAAQDTYDVLENTIHEIEAMASDDGMVYAPCNGMIVSVNVSPGDSVTVMLNNDGEVVAYASLMTMTDISSVYIPITVSEEDILDVYIGQPARVTLTAFPGRTFEAEVDAISVESARSGAATVSYTVTVRLAGENELDMYEGMSAEVTLLKQAVDDVLYVQNQAITFSDGVSTVLVRNEAGEAVSREVETGFSNGLTVEIRSGLEQGEVVLVESGVGARRSA